jgi:hypothetical protein
VEHRLVAHEVRTAPPGRASEAARREACRCWTRAARRASEELDQLEEWDSRTDVAAHREDWRQRLMAADAGGDLQRARAAATQAAALARTGDETAQAAELLVRIECDLGEHRAELRYARTLVRLQPRSAKAFAILRHAALCNHQMALARQADAAWSTLVRPPRPTPADAGARDSASSSSAGVDRRP